MKELPDLDPAFPVTIESREEGSATYFGMSLRDWFAGMALTALIEDGLLRPVVGAGPSPGASWDSVAIAAYGVADAMLRERKVE